MGGGWKGRRKKIGNCEEFIKFWEVQFLNVKQEFFLMDSLSGLSKLVMVKLGAGTIQF